MSNISFLNDKINIKIIDPGVVIRMCSFVKETLRQRADLVDNHVTKKLFNNLVKEFVDERIPKDERFPGKQQSVLVHAEATMELITIRVANQDDPYNMNHFSCHEYRVKPNQENPTIDEKIEIMNGYDNVELFLQHGCSA